MRLGRISPGGNRKKQKLADIVKKHWIRISNTAHTVGGEYNSIIQFGSINVNNNLQNDSSSPLERHVVIVSPAIHWNTGNIGRTCVATGSYLNLIKPLGFSLESKEVKRAGLDYTIINLSTAAAIALYENLRLA